MNEHIEYKLLTLFAPRSARCNRGIAIGVLTASHGRPGICYDGGFTLLSARKNDPWPTRPLTRKSLRCASRRRCAGGWLSWALICRSTTAYCRPPKGRRWPEPCAVGGFEVGNRWCIHPMEGWDANTRRHALGAHAAAVAQLWPQRGQADLGRRGGSRRGPMAGPIRTRRWPPRRTARGLAALLCEAHRCPPRGVRFARRLAGRPATHALRPVLQAGRSFPDARRGSPTTIRCSTPSSRSIRRDESIVLDRRRARPADRRLRGGRPAGARSRLSVRRRQGVPRLLAARVARAPAAGPANTAAIWPAGRG